MNAHLTLIDERPLRILVCGGRDYTNDAHIYLVLEAFADAPVTVVHGAARGADRLAGIAARSLGLTVEAHPADWDRHGRRAGFLRNIAMLDSGVDLVLAFGGARGTDHTVREARKRGLPVREYDRDPRLAALLAA